MKISPVSSPGTTVGAVSAGAESQAPIPQRVRALRMSTNATPGREAALEDAQGLSIPDNVDSANATPEATQPLSPQLAALARQKRALQVKEREIAEREKALTAQKPSDGSVIDVARLKSDPLGVLLDNGVTYDQLTQAVLQSREGSELRQLKDQIKALEEGFDKKLTDRDSQAKQQALAEMRREAEVLAKSDDFELVRETRSVPKAMELIEKTYDTTGEVMDVREALGLIEAELVKESLKLANLKKVQSQLAPQPAPQPQQRQQMRTLTNRDTASVPMSARARALAAFNGTLKR